MYVSFLSCMYLSCHVCIFLVMPHPSPFHITVFLHFSRVPFCPSQSLPPSFSPFIAASFSRGKRQTEETQGSRERATTRKEGLLEGEDRGQGIKEAFEQSHPSLPPYLTLSLPPLPRSVLFSHTWCWAIPCSAACEGARGFLGQATCREIPAGRERVFQRVRGGACQAFGARSRLGSRPFQLGGGACLKT